ncbi:MAG: MoaD/ThiS family protein [Candidatus Verstraetearchaeota archaeon]|nr:MoaD/ThiS family protein [Candidatus Verstraetearchaeota archaeon]
MKKIIVKFVSVFAEKLGSERIVELDDNATLNDLIEMISHELEDVKTKGLVFVNYRFPEEGRRLNDGDVVLIMPMYAGG